MKKSKTQSSGLNEKDHKASIHPAEKELERLNLAFAPLFGNLTEADLPRITIQSRGRKRNALGWFAPKRWIDKDGTHMHELTICAEALNLPIEETVDSLLHEMVHHANYLAGIRDAGNDNRYHNRRFKEKAESVGLIVEKDMRLGWSRTSLGPELKQILSRLNVKADVFAAYRIQPPENGKQPTKMKKWVCACPVIVRCAVEMHGHCDDCGEPWRLAEAMSPPVANAA
jgi:hypothetical protein